jgi:hypothetical protein
LPLLLVALIAHAINEASKFVDEYHTDPCKISHVEHIFVCGMRYIAQSEYMPNWAHTQVSSLSSGGQKHTHFGKFFHITTAVGFCHHTQNLPVL